MRQDDAVTAQWITAGDWRRLTAEETDVHRICTHRGGWWDRYADWVVETVVPGGSGGPEPGELEQRFGFTPRGWLLREWSQDQQPACLMHGEAPGLVEVREDGVAYLVDPGGGYSSGLFLDQRLNRRWVAELGARRLLNLFAYTCSFSVCGALAGAETLSVDTSKRAIERGRENFRRNGLAVERHRFVVEDVVKFVPRLVRRRETFDAIILDPPTFGRADGRVFRIERDLPDLIAACADLLTEDGALLVSCNYARWDAAALREVCVAALPGRGFVLGSGELPPEIPRGAVSWRVRRAR
jgi:23S rRNA (cytosine1962-C5)-methyltransferase